MYKHIDMKNKLYTDNIPIGNYLVMLLITVVFAAQFLGDPHQNYLTGLILKKTPSYNGFLGYFWLHTSLLHIAGNLATLAIFGRSVSVKLGAAKYFLIYIVLGYAAACAHILLDGRSVIGASGAIYGILGMAVVLSYRKLSLLGPWLIFVWFAVSIGAAVAGGSPDAYIAHIAGFIAGMLIAAILAVCNLVDRSDIDLSLARIFVSAIEKN
jgi:membrane associated rhomboid family serine protease